MCRVGPGKFFQPLRAAVGRAVVDQNHLVVVAPQRLADGLVQWHQVLHFVKHRDDNRELHFTLRYTWIHESALQLNAGGEGDSSSNRSEPTAWASQPVSSRCSTSAYSARCSQVSASSAFQKPKRSRLAGSPPPRKP